MLARVRLLAAVAAAAALSGTGAVTPLAPGDEAAGSVPLGGFAYFNGTITGPSAYALLTLLAGEADLYVSLGAGRLPTAAASDYAARWSPSLPLVAVRIDATDAAWVAACGAGAASCAINIGVYGVFAANFSVAYRGPSDALELAPGVPVIAPVPSDGPWWNHRVTFALPVPTGAGAPVDLVAISVGVTGLDAPLAAYFGSSLKGEVPDPDDPGSYCAAWSYDGAAVKINAVTFTSYAFDTDCWCGLNAAPPAVPFAGGACEFFFTVTTAAGDDGGATVQAVGAYTGSGPQALLDGVPAQGSTGLAAGAQYTFVPVAAGPEAGLGSRSITLSVQPLAGNVGVYVTLDGSVPTPSNYVLASVGVPGLQLVDVDVSPGSPFAEQCDTDPSAPAPCLVRVGLYGTAPSNAFLLTAAFSSYIRLLPGVPYVGDLGYAADGSGPETALFSLGNALPGADVTFTLTALNNRPRMAGGSDAPAYNGSLTVPRPNTPGSYAWGPEARSYTVPQPAPTANITAATFFVGVAGRDDPDERTLFSLVATFAPANGSASTYTLLQLGLPQDGAVADDGGWDEEPAVYELPWPSPDTLTVTLSTQNRAGGNVRLAVNLGGLRAGADYDVRTADVLKEVAVSQTDPQFQARCPNGPNEWCVQRVATGCGQWWAVGGDGSSAQGWQCAPAASDATTYTPLTLPPPPFHPSTSPSAAPSLCACLPRATAPRRAASPWRRTRVRACYPRGPPCRGWWAATPTTPSSWWWATCQSRCASAWRRCRAARCCLWRRRAPPPRPPTTLGARGRRPRARAASSPSRGPSRCGTVRCRTCRSRCLWACTARAAAPPCTRCWRPTAATSRR
jgi:hypothetical protein